MALISEILHGCLANPKSGLQSTSYLLEQLLIIVGLRANFIDGSDCHRGSEMPSSKGGLLDPPIASPLSHALNQGSAWSDLAGEMRGFQDDRVTLRARFHF